MSRENVEVVRGGYEAFNRRDTEAIFEAMHPGVEFQTTVETHYGPEGVVEWIRRADEIFGSFEISLVEVVDLGGDDVLAIVHERASGNDSGIEIDQHFGHVWTVRDGRVVAFRSF